MHKHFVKQLSDFLRPVLDGRIEQVQLEVERNPKTYPLHAAHYREYQQTRDALKRDFPNASSLVDDLISIIDLRYSDLNREIYWQGACDCAELLQRLFHNDRSAKENAE